MEKKKFLNGTGLGSKSEPATRSSSAPIGAATGVVELDDDSLASVSGGRYLSHLAVYSYKNTNENCVLLCSSIGTYALKFDHAVSLTPAVEQLSELCGKDVTAQMIMDRLANVGLRPTNADAFVRFWDD